MKRHKQDRGFILTILALGHGVSHWIDQSFPVLLPTIASSLGLGTFQIGIIAYVRQIGFGVGNIPGLLVDMLRKYWGIMLAGCLIWTSISYILVGASFSYYMLIITIFFASLPGALWHLPAAASLSRRFPDRRGFALSIHGFGGNIGNAIGPFTVGILLTVLAWRGVLLVQALPIFLVAIVIKVFLKDLGMDSDKKDTFSLRNQIQAFYTVLRNNRVMGLAGVGVIREMALSSMFLWTPFYLTEEIGMGSFQLGIHMGLLTGMGIISTPFLGSMSDRHGRKIILIPGFIFSGILMALTVSAGNGIWLTVVICALGLFSFSLHQVIMAAVLDYVKGGTEATTVSVMFGAGGILSAFSALITAGIVDSFGIEYVYYYQAVLTGLALLLLLAIPMNVSNRNCTNGQTEPL